MQNRFFKLDTSVGPGSTGGFEFKVVVVVATGINEDVEADKGARG